MNNLSVINAKMERFMVLILCLYNLIRKGSAPFTNPYNRIELPRSLLTMETIFFKWENIMEIK